MKVLKQLPCELYDLETFERWLNGLGAKGFLLTSFNQDIAVFSKFEEPQAVSYKVRYIPGLTDCKKTVFFGDYYVYNSYTSPTLPCRSQEESQQAAKNYSSKTGRWLLGSGIGLIGSFRILFPNLEMLNTPVYWIIIAAFFTNFLLRLTSYSRTTRFLTANRQKEYKPKKPIPFLLVNIFLIAFIILTAIFTIQ